MVTNKTMRIRGHNDSSIVVTETEDSVKIETFVRGGKTYFNMTKEKARELGEALLGITNKK